MGDRLRSSLARLGRNVIDGIWRIGVMARFFGLVLASSGTSFNRFRLVMREVYFTGVLSLILWVLILIVTVKYVLILLRADNRGEGGTFALENGSFVYPDMRAQAAAVRTCLRA